jgi:hypothetical protein
MSTHDNERWRTMLAQAEHFAAVENTAEAAARSRLAADEIRAALAAASDEREKRSLAGLLEHAEALATEQRAAHDAWLAGVTERAAAFEDREARVYKAPKPGRLAS